MKSQIKPGEQYRVKITGYVASGEYKGCINQVTIEDNTNTTNVINTINQL